jgi:hypothetical protein
MSSRQVLPQQAGRSRDSLVSALRAHGDHTELIAQRTRRFLQWKPNGSDRDAWLAEVLPAEWHATKAVAALNAVVSSGNNGTASDSTPNAGVPEPAVRRQRHGRR